MRSFQDCYYLNKDGLFFREACYAFLDSRQFPMEFTGAYPTDVPLETVKTYLDYLSTLFEVETSIKTPEEVNKLSKGRWIAKYPKNPPHAVFYTLNATNYVELHVKGSLFRYLDENPWLFKNGFTPETFYTEIAKLFGDKDPSASGFWYSDDNPWRTQPRGHLEWYVWLNNVTPKTIIDTYNKYKTKLNRGNIWAPLLEYMRKDGLAPPETAA